MQLRKIGWFHMLTISMAVLDLTESNMGNDGGATTDLVIGELVSYVDPNLQFIAFSSALIASLYCSSTIGDI